MQWVRLVLLCMFGLLLWPGLVWAAEFTAMLSRDELSQDEYLILNLALEGAKTQEDPDLSGIDPFFDVKGVKKGANIRVVNGAMTQSITWQYHLAPRRSGSLTIPSLSLQTDAGTLHTRPLHVQIAQGSGRNPAPRPSGAKPKIGFSSSLSKRDPYVGEMVIERVVIYRGDNILDTFVDKPSAQGARVEMAKEHPTQFVEKGGERWAQSVLDYAVTPLQEGRVTVLPAQVEGTLYIAAEDVQEYRDFFGDDPLGVLNQMMRGRGLTEKFQRRTPEEVLQVKPIPDAWNVPKEQWLPALLVEARQRLDTPVLKVGEPVTREISVTLLGAFPEAVPNLEAMLRASLDSSVWQLYAGKPETSFSYDEKYRTVRGRLKQQFTYVPLKEGRQMLPEVRLHWWDTANDQMTAAVLEGAAMEIAEGEVPAGIASAAPEAVQAVAEPSRWSFIDRLVLSLAVVAGMAGLGWVLSHKLGVRVRLPLAQTPWGGKTKAVVPAEDGRKRIHQARDAVELASAVDGYLRARFGFVAGETLRQRAEALAAALSAPDAKELQALCRQLEGAAYGGSRGLELSQWKKRFLSIMERAEKSWRRARPDAPPTLTLNP